MARDALEERLDKVFENVNGWLKFAEAKNAALLTLNAAATFGLHRLHAVYKPAADWAFYLLLAVTVLLFISLLICLASFFARTKIPRSMVARSPDGVPKNLMFYGDLADLNCHDVVKKLAADTGFTGRTDKHHEDLAAQIVINSKIARKKYALFNVALWITMTALVSPVGAILFYWGLCDEVI